MQFNPNLSQIKAAEKSTLMYSLTKGTKSKINNCWEGGSESEMFNSLEKIISSKSPKTPILKSSITRCLEEEYVSDDVTC